MGVYTEPHRPTPRPWKLPTTEDEWQIELKLLGMQIAKVLSGIAISFDEQNPGWGKIGADVSCPHRKQEKDHAHFLNMDLYLCGMCFQALKTMVPKLNRELVP